MLQDDKNYRIEMQDVEPLIDTLLTIIRKLLGSLAVAEGIIHLWNFIFLSHAAAHTYITYGHTDHFRWLQQQGSLFSSEESLEDENNTLQSTKIINSFSFQFLTNLFSAN